MENHFLWLIQWAPKKQQLRARVEGSRWRPSSFGWSPLKPTEVVLATDKGAARARVDSTDESSPQV
eukprot:scaffold12794_cov125-Isochrysis_galbana.AAC.1